MKTHTLALLILLSLLAPAMAQTVADSQKQALTKYPELAKEGSGLHTQFMALYRQAKESNQQLLDDPNWPMILAEKASALSTQPAPPKTEEAASPATPANDAILKRAKQFGLDLSKPLPDVTGPGKSGGFLGMPWGTPPDIANAVMLTRKETALNARESTPAQLFYTGGTFNEYKVGGITLTFVDGGLCEANVLFSDADSNSGVWSDLCTAYKNKYGPAGFGNEHNEIAVWRFQNVGRKIEEISLMYRGYGNILITYSNPALAKKADEVRKSKLGTKDL
jgi:hypothetical protein